ncbi:MAG: AarF/ABC1/UbiB kinase family protein [Deltaproteobacteria bacterium]|nr:AarF/ABC1/UbiB kinase family protein [Deltaproteobacteria bacterium]
MSAHISVRDLPRVRDVALTLASHGFGELARILGIETATSASDKPFAMRARLALADLGTTYIKLGQVLSVRPDILPKALLDELATLQDNAPTVPFDQVKATLETELGRPVDEVFKSFDPVPLASASIAQVHGATLIDGAEVAVKVQRPGIETTLQSDLHILYTLARLVEGQVRVPGLYTPVEIVQEFEQAIATELDFLQEARAAARFRANHEGITGVTIPLIHREYCTRRVLVMERIHGQKLNDVESGSAAGREAMRKFIESWYFQLFEHGFFHGDPHPGNIMVLGTGHICFLDFGLTGTLTGEMQDVMTNIFAGLVFRDAEMVAMAVYRAGATAERVDLKAFRGEIERLMAKYHGSSLSDLSTRGSLTEFIEVATRFRIQLPREFAVVARAGSIVDGIAKRLLPNDDIVEEVRPWAQRLVQRRFGPERVSADAIRVFQQAQAAFRDLPTQANQFLLDLERGRVSVTARDPDSEALRLEIRHAAVRISLALCALALSVSGTMMVATWAPELWGVPIWPFVGFLTNLVALGMFFGLVMHWLFAARIHPREWWRRLGAVFRFFFGGRSS